MKLHLSEAHNSDLELNDLLQGPEREYLELAGNISLSFTIIRSVFVGKVTVHTGGRMGNWSPRTLRFNLPSVRTEHAQTRKDTRATVSTASTYESGTH